LLATALAFAGCALVVRAYDPAVWRVNAWGILAGGSTGLFFAFLSLGGRWSRTQLPSPWTVTAYGFLFAALSLGLTQNLGTLFSMGAAWDGWAILLTLSVGPSLLGYGLYTVSLRYLPAGIAVLISAAEPALTALLAIAVLGEVLIGWQWLGIGVVFLAVLMAQGEGRVAAAEPVRGAPPAAPEHVGP
jgi:drug/metabolite transporter (DMT)-like permease